MSTNPASEIEILKRNYVSACARIRVLEKWVDTVSSPMWKRVWFVMQGYRFRRLGVWYRARWNSDAWNY